jgi:Sec-independent protein secretion pathway component TatC
MGFLEHLDELRTRIIRSCIAIGVGMVVAFAFYDRLADIVLDPITRSLPPAPRWCSSVRAKASPSI